MGEKLFADDPIDSGSQDRFNRGSFASQVAKVAKTISTETSSSVIALVGPWGSGKSSILSIVQKDLKAKKWVVAEFNPWLFSDLPSLIVNFFSEILSAIPQTKALKNKALRKKIGGYAKIISPAGAISSAIGFDSTRIISSFGALLQGDQSVTKLRTDLTKELLKLDKPILVVLDDVDRLHPDELLMVFKLVRLIGRLPNLHYLISYDERTLIDVITQTDLARGNDERARRYLEKIVQIRLDLPSLETSQQIELNNSYLNEVLTRHKIVLPEQDNERLSSAYAECLSLYLDQPRAVKKFYGQIEALFPLLRGEVNFTDFALLTFLRTVEPHAYQLLIEHQAELTGRPSMHDWGNDLNAEQIKTRWIKMLKDKEVKDPEAVFNLLSQLFIPIYNARHNSVATNETFRDQHIQKRAGSPDYFDRYFIFRVGSADIADTVLADNVAKLGKGSLSAQIELKDMIKKNAALTLQKLKDLQLSTDLPANQTLALLADQYGNMRDSEGFSVPPSWSAWDITEKIIASMKPSERLAALKKAMLKDSGVLLIFSTFFGGDGKRKVQLNKPQKDAVKKRVGEALQNIVTRNDKKMSDDDARLIYAYKVMFGDLALKTWMWERINNQGWDLLHTLAMFVSEATSFGGNDKQVRLVGGIALELLESYFGIDELLDRLEDKIVKHRPDSEGFSHKPASLANKKRYVLEVLRGRYDARVELENEPELPDPPEPMDEGR